MRGRERQLVGMACRWYLRYVRSRGPVPHTYLPFVLLTVAAPPLIMLVHGDRIHPSAPGLAFVALLLLGLARGSVVSWTLLLLWNLFLSFAIAAATGAGMLWSAPLLLLVALASAALLLSSSMRRHVGVSRRPTPQRII